METQDSLDIRALQQLVLGPIPEPSQGAGPIDVRETGDVQIACNGAAAGRKSDDIIDLKHTTCASDRRHECSEHDNSRARSQSLQVLCLPVAAEEGLRTQSQPLPKKMSTQGSEEKTQEIAEEELAKLTRKVQEEHFQQSSRIDEDEIGHIDLLKSFEQSHVDRYDEEDNDDDFGELQVRAEIFPESKRFRQPATPATNGKNRIHTADAVTPDLPANPFAQNGASSTGIIPMSQAFKFTQPSSPHRKAIPSDPVSELPSPAVFNAFRSPVISSSSSPTTVAKNKAFTEPGSTDVAAKGQERQKSHRAHHPPPTSGKTKKDESSDDGFDRSAEELMIRRKKAKQKIEEETRRQFEKVSAPSREAANARGKRRGREKPQDKRAKTKSHKIALASGDISNTNTVVGGNTTEDESDDNTKGGKRRSNVVDMTLNVQAQIAKPRAELDERTSVSPSRQLFPTKGLADVDKPADDGLNAVAGVIEVENSQPTLSQMKPTETETQHTSISALPSLPSSLGSGFLVSRSQDDDLPLPFHTNQGFLDGYGEQSSYLPQPPSSSIAQGGSSPLGSQSRSQRLSSFREKNNGYSQNQAADNTHKNPENRQTIIERSSPPLFTTSRTTEYNDSIPSTTVVENSGPIEGIPQQAVGGEHLENLRMREMRTPLNTKLLFSASETTIPETSPAVRRVSRLPLHDHLNSTPQPLPIPPPESGEKWSQDIIVGRQYTNHSSGSNIFETARSQLSSTPTGLTGQNCQSDTPPRRVIGHGSPVTRNSMTFVADRTPSGCLGEDINITMSDSRDVEDQIPPKKTPLSPASKRRKGVDGCVIPETGAKVRSLIASGKAVEPNDARDEHPSSSAGQTEAHDGAATIDNGKPKPLDRIERAKPLPEEVEELGDQNSDPGAAGSNAKEATSRISVPRAKVSHPMPSRSLRTDGASLQNPSATEPRPKGGPTATAMESSPDPGVIEPNRVLALFKNGNMSYFPATCIFVVGIEIPRFKVRFDDGTEDLLESQHVRRFDLRLGDVVKVDLNNMRTKNYFVCGFQDCKYKNAPFVSPRRNRNDPQDYPTTDIRGYSTILLHQKQRDSIPGEETSFNGEEITVPISSVYIVNSMWHKFDDRMYTHVSDFSRPSSRGQTPGGLSSNSVTPTRARRMTPSVLPQAANSDSPGAISRLPNGIFKGMVFAVTYLNEEAEKGQIVGEIIGNGGKVLHDGFEELFLADWFTAASGDNRSFRLKRDAEKFTFACVVANHYSRKPKFIGALALGLPCLHGRWIKDCAKKNEVVDWDPYLLPSGESNYLGGTARSRVLQLYSPLTAKLPDTIASRPKPLEGQSIILVMGKGKAEDRRKVFLFLIFALGASRVSKIPTIEAAKRFLVDTESNPESWDWICVNDSHVKDAQKALSARGAVPGKKRKRRAIEGGDAESDVGFSKVKIMSDEYVMQTTIMGKLMAE